MTTLIEAEGLTKTYRVGSEVIRPVNDLSLRVEPGELLAIQGPSGSGKSTLLHLLGGLDRADEGKLTVAGQDLTALSEGQLCHFRNRHIGFVFQVFHLLPVLSAQENVELPLRLFNMSAAERRDRARAALDLVGLSDRLSHKPGELSGGQQQRVAIARAIVTDPPLVLADEPTGDLDARTGDEIMELFCALHGEQDKTVVMVTHDAAKASRATRQLRFGDGQLHDDGSDSQHAPAQKASA